MSRIARVGVRALFMMGSYVTDVGTFRDTAKVTDDLIVSICINGVGAERNRGGLRVAEGCLESF